MIEYKSNKNKCNESFMECARRCRVNASIEKRNPERIGAILDEIQRIWQSTHRSDERMFQFFTNLENTFMKMGVHNPYMLEDDKVLDMLKEIR